MDFYVYDKKASNISGVQKDVAYSDDDFKPPKFLIKDKDNYMEQNCYENFGKQNSTSKVADYETIRKLIKFIFSELGAPVNKIGTQYWVDAVYLFLKGGRQAYICGDIYNEIADKYNKQAKSIERAMRYCFQNIGYFIIYKQNYVARYLENAVKQSQNSTILFELANLIQDEEMLKIKKQKEDRRALVQKVLAENAKNS